MEPPGADAAAGVAVSPALGADDAGAAAPNRELAGLAAWAGAVELAGAAAPEAGAAEPNSEVPGLAASVVAGVAAGLPPKSEAPEAGAGAAVVAVVAGVAEEADEAPPAPENRLEVPVEVVGAPALAFPNRGGFAGAASVEAAGVLLCAGAAGLLNKLEPEVSAGLEPNILGEEAAGLLVFANRDAPEPAGCVVAVF